MGEQGNEEAKWFFFYGEEYRPISNGVFTAELTESDSFPGRESESFTVPASFSVTLKPIKRYCPSTRKRFIKLCMADGNSRNYANKLAELVRKGGYSYAAYYLLLSITAFELADLAKVAKGSRQPDNAP